MSDHAGGEAAAPIHGSILGHRVLRTEDPDLITGRARYTEDLPIEGALHVAFIRSQFAHARVTSIDTAEARSMPGVIGVYTDADLALPHYEGGMAGEEFIRPVLASERVRYTGEPIAVVLAESRAQAQDAAELVIVDYDPLPVVTDPIAAIQPDAPVLFDAKGSNVAVVHSFAEDPWWSDGADVIVHGRFVNNRLAAVPMEPNGLLAVPGGESMDGNAPPLLTLHLPTQAPHWSRDEYAEKLDLDRKRVRVIAGWVGGGFGAKVPTYPEQLVTAKLAMMHERPVRFVESRSENMTAMNQGRGQVQDVRVAATKDGEILGMQVRLVAETGAYPGDAAFLPQLTRMMAPGVYRLPHVDYHAVCVVANATPIGAYRGAGRPEAAALIERAMDMVAAELGIDPAEIRRRNLVPNDAFPYTTSTNAKYDVGDYGLALDEALRLVGYDDLRREQAERRARGHRVQLGIGIAAYVEITGFGSEFGSVEVKPDGSVAVLTGISPHGQGTATGLAQVAAALLGVPFERVTVVHSDTAVVARGAGTMGSRSLQKGGSAVHKAGTQVIEKAKRIAAHLLEASPDDVAFEDGRFSIAGAPERALTWEEVAAAAADPDPSRRPKGEDPGLREDTDFDADTSFPFGAHIAVAEVDVETGDARLVRIVAVDDCGTIVNPMLVEGQQHGGLGQGIAQALYEGIGYDDLGNPLNGNLMAYSMPSAADLPSFEAHNTVTPTPINPLGAKGIGESATIGSTPAVQNAVIDAVSHLGVRHIDMPLTPERVWRAIEDAKAGRAHPDWPDLPESLGSTGGVQVDDPESLLR
jgi:carbon-monoxide dehydrogenase large subunit